MAWTAPSTKTTGTLVTAAIWNEQVTNNMTWLGTSHDHNGGAGDGATLAGLTPLSGMIAIFDTACPTGWTRVSAWDDKMLRGGAAYGATGGADTHLHSDTAHSHADTHTHAVGTLAVGAGAVAIQIGAGGTTVSAEAHTHAISGTSGTPVATGSVTIDTSNTLPPYVAVVFCKKDA